MRERMPYDRRVMRALVRALAVASLVCALAARPAAAQESATSGTLSGTVRDPTGAAVVGASVTARDLLTHRVRAATSGPEGAYRIAGLPAGSYEIRVDALGYAPSVN